MKSSSSVPENYFQLHINLLRAVGLSLEKKKESCTYKTYSTLIFLMSCSLPGFMILDMSKREYDDFNNFLSLTISFFVAGSKGVVFYFIRNKVKILMAKLQKAPFLPNKNRGGNIEIEFIKKFYKISSIQTKLYVSLAIMYYVVNSCYAYFRRIIHRNDHNNWHLPYTKFYLVNTTYSPNYEMISLYETVSIFGLGLYFVVPDLIIVGMLCNVSYQFRILIHFIKTKLSSKNPEFAVLDTESDVIISWIHFKIFAKDAVDYHLEIINFIQELENTLSAPMLIFLVNTLIVLGSLVFEVSVLSPFNVMFWGRLLQLSAATVQVFLFSYWIERIRDDGKNVGRAAYDVSVDSSDSRCRSAIKMIIIRSQTPVKITAGKFTEIGMPTFAWMIRAAYSSFMLLKNSQA